MTKTILILAIATAFMIGTSISFVADYDAEAKPAKKAKPVFVDGKGFIQTFTCPDLSQVGIFASPTFFTFAKGEGVFVVWPTQIDDTSSPRDFTVGWANAEISETDFKLIGTITLKGAEFCPTALTMPSKVIMTGTCGLGQTATITTEEGFVITLNTDVVCG